MIDEESREELGNLSIIFWQDQFFVENTKVETAFVEENKYRNYYEGSVHLQFPRYAVADSMLQSFYDLFTSRTSGSIRTPWYGELFDENRFEYAASYQYNIYLPTNLSNITELHSGDLYFVLDFYMDVSLYPGNEYVWIGGLGKTGEIEYDEYIVDYKDVTVYEAETLYQTGNISVVRKFKTSELSDEEVAYISMSRILNEKRVENKGLRNFGHLVGQSTLLPT